MTGLILKDFINLKKYMRTLLIIVIFYGVIFIPQGKSNFMCSFLLLLAAMPVVSAMSLDDYSKWNPYALTMPVKRKDLVLSKYLLMLIFIISGGILCFGVLTISTLKAKTFNISEISSITVAFTCIAIIYDSINMPIIFKIGTEKAKLIMLLVLFIPIGIALLLSNVISKNDIAPVINTLNNMQNILPILAVGLTVIIALSSYFISTNIFAKKEF